MFDNAREALNFLSPHVRSLPCCELEKVTLNRLNERGDCILTLTITVLFMSLDDHDYYRYKVEQVQDLIKEVVGCSQVVNIRLERKNTPSTTMVGMAVG